MWELPNPFLRADGTTVKEKSEWQQQRIYLKNILEENMYGKIPMEKTFIKEELQHEKTVLDGRGVFRIYKLRCGPDEAVTFEVYSVSPTDRQVSVPIVMNGGFFGKDIAELAVDNGFSIFTYNAQKAAPDNSAFMDGQCYLAYPQYSWRVIAMWGWIQMRIIDWLETKENLDVKKVTVCGHSRYGKASLCAGVYDDRVAACVAAGSGCGGFGSLRRIGSRYGENTGFVETLGYMLRKGKNDHWFLETLRDYGAERVNGLNRENELPFDANFIGAAIAPKPLLILEGLEDSWANPFGTQLIWNAVSEVYDFLEVNDRLGIHFREGGHEFNLDDWKVMIDFIKVNLFGEKKTTRYKTRGTAETPCGHSWRNPVMDNVPAVSYGDYKSALMANYADYPGDMWIFRDFNITPDAAKITSELFAKYAQQSAMTRRQQ